MRRIFRFPSGGCLPLNKIGCALCVEIADDPAGPRLVVHCTVRDAPGVWGVCAHINDTISQQALRPCCFASLSIFVTSAPNSSRASRMPVAAPRAVQPPYANVHQCRALPDRRVCAVPLSRRGRAATSVAGRKSQASSARKALGAAQHAGNGADRSTHDASEPLAAAARACARHGELAAAGRRERPERGCASLLQLMRARFRYGHVPRLAPLCSAHDRQK